MSDKDRENQALGVLQEMNQGIKDLLGLARGSNSGADDEDPPATGPTRKRRKVRDDAPPRHQEPDPEPDADEDGDEDPPATEKPKGFLRTFLGG